MTVATLLKIGLKVSEKKKRQSHLTICRNKKKLLKILSWCLFPFTNDFVGTLCECQSHYAHFCGCGVLNLPVIPGFLPLCPFSTA